MPQPLKAGKALVQPTSSIAPVSIARRRIGDDLLKYFPALLYLILNLYIGFIYFGRTFNAHVSFNPPTQSTMHTIQILLQIIIALGIFNVWFLRFNNPSGWRGGKAANMKEEFAVYGLPEGSVYAVGFLKVLCAILLLVGIFAPVLVTPAAIGMVILMTGAMIMHFKVGDPPKRALPSIVMLVMSTAVALI